MPQPEGRDLQRPFLALGAVLTIGLALAVVVAASGVPGLGLFTLERAVLGLGAALLVTALILFVLLVKVGQVLTELASVREEHRKLASRLERRNEGHHILRIPGVGEAYANRLNAVGIITIPQLVDGDAGDLARSIGARRSDIEAWQAIGRFSLIPGIDTDTAGQIHAAGIQTVADLARADPDRLAGALDNRDRARNWVQAAGAYLESHTIRR